MRLQRILEMSPAELAFRGRQHLARTVDRFATSLGGPGPVCHYETLAGDAMFQRIALLLERGDAGTEPGQLQERFAQFAPSRFFAGASEPGVAAGIATDCAQARQRIIENADAVCREEFDILGYGKLSFGSPINWQLDAVSGHVAAPAHGSRVRYLANDQVGDSKVVWELNRHQWLLDLGQAWRFTGNACYAEASARLVRDWMSRNPPGFGMNWSSSLEAGLRLISWCWALFLFRGAAAFSADLFLEMLAWMQAHARFVERNLSRYFSPNTHLTGEALALFYAGVLLPELEGANRWSTLGREILVAQLERQVFPDGVYFEQSTRYQYYTVEIYLHFIILAERNHVAIPASVRDRLGQMVEFLLQLRRPDGTVPQIGDTDGGWLLPLVRREPGDYRGLFSTAAALLRNAQFAWAAGEVAPETRWLMGSQGADARQCPEPAAPRSVEPRCFPDGGYVVMRSGWDGDAHQLIFDTGPLGCSVSGGHGHADLLSVQCSASGENFLVDAGTFCYTADADWRRFFRSSQAHSTVLVDGLGQAEPEGPFSWRRRPSARMRQVRSVPGYCLADAEHDAWALLDDPVSHRRRVLFVDSSYWLIIDDLGGHAEHRIDLRYQFAPLPVEIEDDGWVRARGNGSALLLKTFSSVSLSATVDRGVTAPPVGWYSPNYGLRIPAPALTCSAIAALPLRIVTILWPLADAGADAPQVMPLMEADTVAGVTFATGNPQTVFIYEREVFIQTPA